MTYLDGTLGGAGHAQAIARAVGGKLTLVGLDRDPDAIVRGKEMLSVLVDEASGGRLILANEDFRTLGAVLEREGIAAVDAILLDLGLSSDELESSGKGFSFQNDEPLQMTMGDPSDKQRHPYTAADIVNGWEEETLANIIFGYAEERYARRIARAIVSYRGKKPIETTMELAEIVRHAVPPPYRRGKIHPATKTFQALRIAVNDELAALKEGLAAGFAKLAPKGAMAIISFHSLEDRIVKDFFKSKAADGATLITKKPITASSEEVAANPRARSAKLRIIRT